MGTGPQISTRTPLDLPVQKALIISSLVRRLHQGANQAMVLIVGGIFCLFRFILGGPPINALELAVPFFLIFAHLCLAPIPWQWTGSDAPRADLPRGLLQAFLFHGLWIGLVIASLLLFGPPPPRPPFPPPPGEHGGFLLPVLGMGLINLALATIFGWVLAEKEAVEAREQQQAELLRRSQAQALQNQLEPHVLYNALSGLAELVYEDPLAAEDVITRLADLYRMLSVHGKAEYVSLGEERRLVEAYLAVEQMRLGERLVVSWNWPEEFDPLLLPPLLLQPLVENAIKHGISPMAEGGKVDISCQFSDGVVALQVFNTGRPLGPRRPDRLGLGNLEARLALWPKASGSFQLEAHGEGTLARVLWRMA